MEKNLHLSHVNMVDFDDQESHAKPAGVKDIQIFIIITDADVAETPALDTFSYAGTTSGGRYKHTFTDAQEGKRAWYYARFVFTGKVPTYGTPSKVWDGIIS